MQNAECRTEANAGQSRMQSTRQKREQSRSRRGAADSATQRRKPAELRAMKENKREPELAGERAPLYGARSVRVSARGESGDYCHALKERRTSSNAAH